MTTEQEDTLDFLKGRAPKEVYALVDTSQSVDAENWFVIYEENKDELLDEAIVAVYERTGFRKVVVPNRDTQLKVVK